MRHDSRSIRPRTLLGAVTLFLALAASVNAAEQRATDSELEHLAGTILLLGDPQIVPDDIARLMALPASTEPRRARHVSTQDDTALTHGIVVLQAASGRERMIVLVRMPNANERQFYVTSTDGVLRSAYSIYADRTSALLMPPEKANFARELAFWLDWEVALFERLGVDPRHGLSKPTRMTRR